MLFPLYDDNPHHRIPWFTGCLIAVNVAVMFWLWQMPPDRADDIVARFGFTPKRLTTVNGPDVKVPLPNRDHRGRINVNLPAREVKVPNAGIDVYPTLVTMMFLHGGWFHLIFNMWMLWVFGNNVEDRLGHFPFLFFYLAGGVVAILCQWAFDPNSTMPVIGASGAVAAVLGGYAVTFPTAKVRTLLIVPPLLLRLPALLVLGLWFLLQLIEGLNLLGGFVNMHVAFWAHIGGFVAGLVLMPLMGIGAQPPDSDWRKEVDDLFHFGDSTPER